MKIAILCTSRDHPVNVMLTKWIERQVKEHEVVLARDKSELTTGDLLFLISCGQILTLSDRRKFLKVLVTHASDLPYGRGWSPHIWGLLGGAKSITVSLLEASDKVDTGDIWKKMQVTIPKHALYDEINIALFKIEYELMDFAVEAFRQIEPYSQIEISDERPFRRRTPADSELDPKKGLEDQFDLLRVSDSSRFPAFVKLHGHRYKVLLEKLEDE